MPRRCPHFNFVSSTFFLIIRRVRAVNRRKSARQKMRRESARQKMSVDDRAPSPYPHDPSMIPPEQNIGPLIERLDKVFQDEQEYTKFLGCRGASAQQLLDFLQDLLDYDSTLIAFNKRRFHKAFISLSEKSGLLPRCLTISGLKQGSLVAGGAFADVYKGSLDGLSFAVKMMRAFEDSDIATLLKQFGREALIWRQLCHPNLLPFVGLYYFQNSLVSPWMDNGHVVAFLKKELHDTDYLLSIILDVALGLKELHDQGIVHGDLTGTNILVAPSHRACIADFGLSSIITAISSVELPHSSRRPHGTIRYQAPELFQGKYNDLCSDIYALGCVIFELVTGEPPFPGLGDGAVIKAVVEGHRPSRPESWLGTPPLDSLWNLLQNCWEGLPEMRPTVAHIVERLMGPDIQAKQTESNEDWAHPFTSRLRQQVLGGRPLPSVLEVEGMIFGDM